MMTFYTGPNHREYEKKFKALKRYFIEVEGVENSNAAVFRHMINKLYTSLMNSKIKKGGM